LNPTAVLGRGYAIVQDLEGHVVQSTAQVHPDLPLSVRVSDGNFPVVVTSQPHLFTSSHTS
jgi:exodeoxyribonuclease VII large subunit